jgi:hypothetical protein
VSAAVVADTIPAPAPETEPAYYRLEVQSREWAGILRDGWRPAIAGTLNQTRDDDETASTFSTVAEAMSFLTEAVLPEGPEAVRVVRSDGVVLYSADFAKGGK